MSATISAPTPTVGLLASKWAVKPTERSTRKTTTSSGLLNSKWAPESTTNAQPNSALSETTGNELQTKPTQAETQAATSTPTQTDSTHAEPELVIISGPKPTSATELVKTSEPEDAVREPFAELLPTTTVQPYQKKSWADLVDEDDDDIFNIPEISKENFPSAPTTNNKPIVNASNDDKENIKLQSKDENEDHQPQWNNNKENLPSQPNNNKENLISHPKDDHENLSQVDTTSTNKDSTDKQTIEQPNEDKKAPATMFSSRWADSSYEIKGAQTRAEYRATHGPSNKARRTTKTTSSSRRRRSGC
ncbi:hypothetical protein DIS24_g1094 [Lasiodiplodia hormozganensis]|uniref:Uncharacterized protein n=1 Tax=Lasiodiplodia hormozganensis TaxID=869390 RepID=A0AA39Z4U3_9PEZI|nr:hypothetical protein DIS24_g1094 [Lasiodiplodia hormozganensis]